MRVLNRLALVLLTSSAFELFAADEKSLAEQIPRIPPKTINEAQKSFHLQKGFSLELVACEPDVVDPIDAAFDESGRMYVVEMNDYPFLPDQRVQKYRDQRSETWGRIRLLTDTDGDGRMDRSVIFADQLHWPQSVCCSQGGVFVLAPPNLFFMKDTNGDGVADDRHLICSGFASSNVQGLTNGLEWGRDNAIYFASGMAGGELTIPARNGEPESKFTPGRRDLRLDPKTWRLTMVSGGQQFGHSIDNWGERFICSNSNHIVHATWPLHELERNPQVVVSDLTRSIAAEGAAAVVFRTSAAEPWRLVRTARRAADPEMRKRLPPSELVPVGFFTSATGVTIYRGGAYPQEFHGQAFIGDCGANLVHRKNIRPHGITFVAERADEGVEFLTSDDNWFRPVNFVNAPDGTLYILDMYRETIEHPASIPDDIKALVDLESGYDKGRIWRLVPPGYHRVNPPDLSRMAMSDLVDQLVSPHGVIRDTAQRLLVERMDPAAAPLVRAVAFSGSSTNTHSSPEARSHAIWALSGLNHLNDEDLLIALRDPDEHLREVALQLVTRWKQKSAPLESAVLKLTSDPSARVRWRLALTLGELSTDNSIAGLKALAVDAAKDSDLRTAWISSIQSQMSPLAIELMSDKTGAMRPLLIELARLIGSAPDPRESLRLLDELSRDAISDSTRVPILIELAEGLRRRGATLAAIIEKSSSKSAVNAALSDCFERAGRNALNLDLGADQRLAAIRLLAYSDAELAQRTLPQLFTPQTAIELQTAAVRSLAAQGNDAAFGQILEPWKTFGPSTRREIIDNLSQTVPGATNLLNAIKNSAIRPNEVDRDQRQLLLNHPQAVIRDVARVVLAETPSNRKQVIENYQPALDLKGDVARGRMLYSKTCVQCHRIGPAGHQVGPDFASVQNKSEADLLVAILDPNREALPRFQTYTAVTRQGKIYTGIIASETSASLTLKRAEAKEDIILRETIDELVSNGTSLMPEGLEKDLDPQQLADIIAAIKAGP